MRSLSLAVAILGVASLAPAQGAPVRTDKSAEARATAELAKEIADLKKELQQMEQSIRAMSRSQSAAAADKASEVKSEVKSAKAAKTDKAAKAEKSERAEKAEKPEKAEKAERAEKSEKAEKAAKTTKQEQGEEPLRARRVRTDDEDEKGGTVKDQPVRVRKVKVDDSTDGEVKALRIAPGARVYTIQDGKPVELRPGKDGLFVKSGTDDEFVPLTPGVRTLRIDSGTDGITVVTPRGQTRINAGAKAAETKTKCACGCPYCCQGDGNADKTTVLDARSATPRSLTIDSRPGVAPMAATPLGVRTRGLPGTGDRRCAPARSSLSLTQPHVAAPAQPLKVTAPKAPKAPKAKQPESESTNKSDQRRLINV